MILTPVITEGYKIRREFQGSAPEKSPILRVSSKLICYSILVSDNEDFYRRRVALSIPGIPGCFVCMSESRDSGKKLVSCDATLSYLRDALESRAALQDVRDVFGVEGLERAVE